MKKKKQKNKRWVQVYSTTIRNVALKVNFCTNHKTNITSLNGYLIDVKTRIRHDADVSVSTSVQDARDIDRMVKVLIARATAVYEKKSRIGFKRYYFRTSAHQPKKSCVRKGHGTSCFLFHSIPRAKCGTKAERVWNKHSASVRSKVRFDPLPENP